MRIVFVVSPGQHMNWPCGDEEINKESLMVTDRYQMILGKKGNLFDRRFPLNSLQFKR